MPECSQILIPKYSPWTPPLEHVIADLRSTVSPNIDGTAAATHQPAVPLSPPSSHHCLRSSQWCDARFSPVTAAPVQGQVDIQDVSFAFPSRPTSQVLSSFTLHVPACQVTALVGTTNCGKSTLLQLLQRLYDPTSGRICVDGMDVRSLSLKWYRTQARPPPSATARPFPPRIAHCSASFWKDPGGTARTGYSSCSSPQALIPQVHCLRCLILSGEPAGAA